VVLYEGEDTIVELARYLEKDNNLNKIKGLAYKDKNNNIIKNELRPLIEPLDKIPFPSRDLLPELIKKGGLPVISSSRGCYNRCSFCTVSQFYNDPKGSSFRLRSAENVIEELKQLKKDYPNINEVWFVDDNFVTPGKKGIERAKKLCEGIKSLGFKHFDIYLRANDINEEILKLLKESGIRSIFIGAESGCDNTLQNIFNKNITVKKTKDAILLCKKFGVNIDPGFIMFHPWSTLAEVEQNIKFLKEIGTYTPYAILSFLTACKFTPIGKDMLSGKRPYKKQRINKKVFLQDEVPYEIIDEKAELLLSLTLKAFQNFRDYPKALFELKRFARISKKKSVEKFYSEKYKCYNESAMKYFEKLFFYLKDNGLKNEDNLINFFKTVCKEIKQETQVNVNEIYSLINKS
jgi:radical SAM superfamily enzyme YgiQ (UPF0313 family)